MTKFKAAPFIADAEIWGVIRAAYLGGAPAPAIEKAIGVKANTIWKRAQDEGWGRRAGAGAASCGRTADALDPEGEEETIYPPVTDPLDLVGPAIKKAAECFHGGRPIDMQRYLRAAQMARSLARPDLGAPKAEEVEEDKTTLAEYRAEVDRRLAVLDRQIERKKAEIAEREAGKIGRRRMEAEAHALQDVAESGEVASGEEDWDPADYGAAE